MKYIITESQAKKIIKEESDYSNELLRRKHLIDKNITKMIDQAKKELDEDDFSDYFEYLENLIYWIVQELQSEYGSDDDFWYNEEGEISDYIKYEYDNYLMS